MTREEAKKILEAYIACESKKAHFECSEYNEAINMAIQALGQQPKTGHWICTAYDGYADGYPVYDMWECSECGHEHSGESGTLTDFCPGCGARMFELRKGAIRNEM